jgi:MspA
MSFWAKSLLAFGGAMILAIAGTSTVAVAEITPMPPKFYEKVSRDGWRLTLTIDNEVVNSVPNLAASTNSREGFVTASATAAASGGSSPITDSLLILGYQLGCQTDVSAGLNLGATGGVGPTAGIGFGSGIPVGASAGISSGVAGFAQTVLQPGVIVDMPMTNMSLNESGSAMLDIDNLHIKADACGGDVTIRSYAYFRISTADAHTQFAAYGEPTKI